MLEAVEKGIPNVPARLASPAARTRRPTASSARGATPRAFRLPAAGALGPRPRARHPRLRARREARGRAVHRAPGRRRRGSRARSSSSCSTCTPTSRATRRSCRPSSSTRSRSSEPASFRSSRQDLFQTRERLLPDPDGGGAGHEPPPRRDPAGGGAADRSTRAYTPCFRSEAGRRRARHARHDPPAPVRQGRGRHVRAPGGLGGRARDARRRTPRSSCGASSLPYRVVLALHRRHGVLGGEDLRPRGLAARA